MFKNRILSYAVVTASMVLAACAVVFALQVGGAHTALIFALSLAMALVAAVAAGCVADTDK